MTASEIILTSEICRQAARNIHPEEPDELFNSCWLAIREREIRDPSWKPKIDPKRYFLRMMRNKARDWQKKRKHERLDTIQQRTDSINQPYGIQQEEILIQWLNQPETDPDVMFLKDILILAIYCKDINDACKAAEMGRTSFWKYKRIAQNKFYEYYLSTDHCKFSSIDIF